MSIRLLNGERAFVALQQGNVRLLGAEKSKKWLLTEKEPYKLLATFERRDFDKAQKAFDRQCLLSRLTSGGGAV